MGQAGRRTTRSRSTGGSGRTSARGERRRSRRRVPAGIGGALAVVAIGLVTLGAPATELAAQVTAAWTPFRTFGSDAAGTASSAGADDGGLVDVHVTVPAAGAPVITVPLPDRIEIELVPPTVPHGVIPEFTPPPAACGGYSSPRQIPPGVEPGPGSATLSWMADSNPNVRAYRVQAISQVLVPGEQPTPPSAEVAQRDDCGQVTASISGLTPGGVYVFWLEEAIYDDDAEVVRYVQVGTSSPTAVG